MLLGILWVSFGKLRLVRTVVENMGCAPSKKSPKKNFDIETDEGPNHYFRNGQWLGMQNGKAFTMDKEGVPISDEEYKIWLQQIQPAGYTLPKGWHKETDERGRVLWLAPGKKKGHRSPPDLVPPHEEVRGRSGTIKFIAHQDKKQLKKKKKHQAQKKLLEVPQAGGPEEEAVLGGAHSEPRALAEGPCALGARP